ncbi:MAG: hypothetical protein OXR73_19245 [Myxococcales bacterium]|nr:hypothetical protein [Myxococcales bacterium]
MADRGELDLTRRESPNDSCEQASRKLEVYGRLAVMAPLARTLTRLLCLLAAASQPGCADEPSLDIRICGDFLVPADSADLVTLSDGAVLEIAPTADTEMTDDVGDDALEDLPVDALRITTRDSDYEPIDLSVLELGSGTTVASKGFKRVVTFPRSDRMLWLTVEGLRGGVVGYSFARRVSSSTEEVDMPLWQACFGVACAFGQTCIDGACELAPDAPGGPSCGGDD